MKNLVKILIGLWLGILVFGGGVFADDFSGCDEYIKGNSVVTSILYDSKKQKSFWKCSEDGSYMCYEEGQRPSGFSCQKFYVYNGDVSSKKGLDLIQSFLSTLLGYVLKFGAMLAVLAIVIGGIQISMNGDSDGESPVGKDKIMGGIAALVVLFFAGVILHFINPAYFTW